MASKTLNPVHISPWIGLPLSAFMIIIALLTFTGTPFGDGESWPLLTTIRDKRSLLHMLNHRARQAPRWLYQGGKGVTSILWSVLIPLQHNNRLRQRFPALHRRSGYTVVLLSIELGLAGYYMLSQDMVTTHDQWYHIHKFYGIPFPPFAWPTFTLAIWILGVFYFYSLYKLVCAIRAKQVEKHRQWAVFHSMTGYAIAIERAIAVSLIPVGWLLYSLPERVQKEVLRMPDDLDGMLEVERDALAWTLAMSGLMIGLWVQTEYSRAGLI